MRVQIIVITVSAIALSGCGIARAAREEKERSAGLQAALAACQATPATTRLANARCIGDAEETYMVPGSPIADLLRVKIATRNSIAARLDAGKITAAEAELEEAKARSELVGEAKRRVNQDRSIAAQQAMAEAASRPAPPLNCVGGPTIATCF